MCWSALQCQHFFVNVCKSCHLKMVAEIDKVMSYFNSDLTFNRRSYYSMGSCESCKWCNNFSGCTVKKQVPFKTSPLPQDFNELHLFVCGKIVSYKISDFLMEIYGGKEFLAVMDDESYALHCSENVFTMMLVRKIH